ncbi:hypothetical protein SEA_TORTELLINI_60 [Mycobacterium phage Tortellini]|uniref:Uncharacterized protein n=1 Tax=Mycobacterium phage Tortellini TaxID=1897497 RepID=A0A1D8EX91_9CAUD|nr:hypothetical protein FDH05_gp60 [Mycobacterium phage Tortellini]AOT25805.1 hypothetical protein SEA_TORTELLINI_60 [Mycobacterium phage Tortellini]
MNGIREFLTANIGELIAALDEHEAGLDDRQTPVIYICGRCNFRGTEQEWQQHVAEQMARKFERQDGGDPAVNATDDGLEPVGEAPEVPVRYDAGIGRALDALGRGAVLGILRSADEIAATAQPAERQAQALNDVRQLCEHWRDTIRTGDGHSDADYAYADAGRTILRVIDEAGA